MLLETGNPTLPYITIPGNLVYRDWMQSFPNEARCVTTLTAGQLREWAMRLIPSYLPFTCRRGRPVFSSVAPNEFHHRLVRHLNHSEELDCSDRWEEPDCLARSEDHLDGPDGSDCLDRSGLSEHLDHSDYSDQGSLGYWDYFGRLRYAAYWDSGCWAAASLVDGAACSVQRLRYSASLPQTRLSQQTPSNIQLFEDVSWFPPSI